MKRVMVNFDDSTGEMVATLAARDKRSVSSYLAVLVERDLRASGLMPSDDLRTQVIAAAEEIGTERALKVLRAAHRKKEPAPQAA